MATLKVSLTVSESSKTVTIDTTDYVSNAEWAEMSEEEQAEAVQSWVDDFDQPCFEVEKITETED